MRRLVLLEGDTRALHPAMTAPPYYWNVMALAARPWVMARIRHQLLSRVCVCVCVYEHWL